MQRATFALYVIALGAMISIIAAVAWKHEQERRRNETLELIARENARSERKWLGLGPDPERQ
jgi:hypothetical protein